LRVQSPAEFDPLIAMQALFLAKPNLLKATHNFYAFVTTTARDNSDDGESGAGRKLAELLSLRRDTNVMVVVSRWFGGVKMGPGRFKVFAHVASTALEKF
jgi:putative IMPACT (imprinted ancient) family translation regulator